MRVLSGICKGSVISYEQSYLNFSILKIPVTLFACIYLECAHVVSHFLDRNDSSVTISTKQRLARLDSIVQEMCRHDPLPTTGTTI